MPFQYYLQASIKYELTHEVILKCLFSEEDFLACIPGIDTTTPIHVKSQAEDSLFDLGLYDENEKCVCLIEIKMWSSLSKDQLDRQTKFLKRRSCKGMHILLGTTDLQYYRGEFDEIGKWTNGLSCKIGYRELIEFLDRFITNNDPAKAAVQMAEIYRDALQAQYDVLQNAWLDPNADRHHYYYSAYDKIRDFLLDRSFGIYKVNNNAGAVFILNDLGSWVGFPYKNYAFELYQELLNGAFMIRIYSKDAPVAIRKEVKQKFINEFKEIEQYRLGWSHNYRTSKWHKVAVFRPQLTSKKDCEAVAILFKELNPVLKDIGKSIGTEVRQTI